MQILLRKALLVSAFFIACYVPWRAALAACSLPPAARHVSVAQVIDGDTVRLGSGESVRLIGINTPEIGRDGRADEAGAQAARQALRRWIEGREVALVPGLNPRDRYGRLLGHLALNGESVAERLVEQGLGFAVSIALDLRLSDCLFAAEARARQARRGLWQQDPVQPAAAVSRGGFALLRGQVTRIDRARRAYYVELDDHLVIRIGHDLIDAQRQSWLQSLQGQQVEVRGWVVDRGGDLKRGYKRWLVALSDLRHLKSYRR